MPGRGKDSCGGDILIRGPAVTGRQRGSIRVGARASAALFAIAVLAGRPTFADRAPIEVRAVGSLRFGTLVKEPGQPGSVSIDPSSGLRQLEGSVIDLGGDCGSAEFEISGEPGEPFRIFLPSSVALGRGRVVREFVAQPGPVGRLGLDGRAVVKVGGTLELAPQVGSGHNDALFTVGAEYL
jgi:hypothetical protein